MSDETRSAPVCLCGRTCARGTYGYFEPTCGEPECALPERKARTFTVFNGQKRNRNGLGTTSVKAIESDFTSGLPTGGQE